MDPAPKLLQVLQLKALVIRVSFEAAIDRMTGVADRDLSHEGIDQEIHPRAGEQGKHAVDRLAPGKKEEADDTSHSDDRDPKISVEVLLDIETVMPTGHAFPDELLRVNRGVHSERNGILTARADHPFSNRGW